MSDVLLYLQVLSENPALVTNLLSTYFFEDAPVVPPSQLWLGTFLVIGSTVLFANG